jgi:uncharacterized membrane protein YuzA (DUF378 family)
MRRETYLVTYSTIRRSAKEEAMEFLRRTEPIWLALVIIGALNWGLVGLFEFNLVEEIFGTGTFTDVVYTIVGVAALLMLPRLLEDFRVSTHRTHATGH